MPKDTFFNLPEAKRQAICQAAIAEFAAHSFRVASINRIVTQAGIAKGSFYQYFENKKDLFAYVVQIISSEKLQYLEPVLEGYHQKEFSQLLRELYRAGIQFAIEHPHYAEISKKFLQAKGTPLHDEILQQNLPAAYQFFVPLLEQAIQRGEVREDVDVNLLAYLLTHLNTLVVEYYIENISTNFNENMLNTIETFLDLLFQGIGVKNTIPQSFS